MCPANDFNESAPAHRKTYKAAAPLPFPPSRLCPCKALKPALCSPDSLMHTPMCVWSPFLSGHRVCINSVLCVPPAVGTKLLPNGSSADPAVSVGSSRSLPEPCSYLVSDHCQGLPECAPVGPASESYPNRNLSRLWDCFSPRLLLIE